MSLILIKGGQVDIQRTGWGDRNPVGEPIVYDASGVAPHATTVRAAYTVATGKKAQVQNIYCQTRITTVATTAGLRQLYAKVDSGGTTYYVMFAEIGVDKNTAGETVFGTVGLSTFLLVGDVISLVTSDSSTGGTMTYTGSVMVTEFDQ